MAIAKLVGSIELTTPTEGKDSERQYVGCFHVNITEIVQLISPVLETVNITCQ